MSRIDQTAPTSVVVDDGPAVALRLRPPRHPVERAAVLWWATRSLVWLAPGSAALLVLARLVGVAPAWWWTCFAGAVAAVLLGVGLVPVLRYRVHRWEVTCEAVYTRRGWLVHSWRVAPIARIQTVDSRRGPLEQCFGLSTVTVTTASAQGALRLDGLDRERAETLVDQLTAITQSTPGDAT